LLPEPRNDLVEASTPLGAPWILQRIDPAENPFEDPIPLRLVAQWSELEPGGAAIDLEALGSMLPRRRVEPVHLHVALLALHALAIDHLNLELTRVVLPEPVGDDHVSKRDVSPLPRAHPAHRQAADVVILKEPRRGDDRVDPAHAERLGHREPQQAA